MRQPHDIFPRHTGCNIVYGMTFPLVRENCHLVIRRNVSQFELNCETIHLGLRKGVSSTGLHWVLGGDNKEGILKGTNLSIDADLALCHCLKQSGLCFRSSSVDFVCEDDIGKDFGSGVFTISCAIESEIATIDEEEERLEFMEAMGITQPSLERINAALYDALGLMSFYTSGEDECRAWTIRKGSSAPVAGGKIHSDIERGFIRVEVMKYDALMVAGCEHGVKQAGKMQLNGKDYIIEDGDICHFLFNV